MSSFSKQIRVAPPLNPFKVFSGPPFWVLSYDWSLLLFSYKSSDPPKNPPLPTDDKYWPVPYKADSSEGHVGIRLIHVSPRKLRRILWVNSYVVAPGVAYGSNEKFHDFFS